MASNLDRYKKDFDSLLARGERLFLALQKECLPEQFERVMKKAYGEEAKDRIKALPSFKDMYQSWYSEARELVRQLLPGRLSDFTRLYEKPKSRKNISSENYKIEDCLQGLTLTRSFGGEVIVGPSAAIPHVQQQLAILASAKGRFESSLFEIRQLVQADLLDSELEAATELVRNKFGRAAGAMAGVVLERHLAQVCDSHAIKIVKKAPTISDFNNALKEADAIDLPQWRFVQHLADIRNLCDHDRKTEPTAEQVTDLVGGVMKMTKTLF
jgi:hypothetical protein